jgi:hypothetical protein
MKGIFMKLFLMFSVSILVFSSTSIADQQAPIFCEDEAKSVKLTIETPYLGENSKFTQTLFTLETVDYRVFFLQVLTSAEGGGSKGHIGKNYKDGRIELLVKWKETGDGTTVQMESESASLTYNHGLMKVEQLPVTCIME